MRSVINRVSEWLDPGLAQRQQEEATKRVQEREALQQELEAWRTSPLGSYFFHRIEHDKQQAMLALAQADPTDTDRILSLQNKYQVVSKIEEYCASIMRAGKQQR